MTSAEHPVTDIPYSHPVPVATLHGESHLRLAPDEAQRRAIAKALDLEAVPALGLLARINHAQNGLVSVEGRLEGLVRPICVVTLEAFDQPVDTPVFMRFAPAALVERMTRRAAENAQEDFEAPDLIEDGIIDFGALVTEFLALSLDPYPRKPGAAFEGAGDAPDLKDSPFAALLALKGQP